MTRFLSSRSQAGATLAHAIRPMLHPGKQAGLANFESLEGRQLFAGTGSPVLPPPPPPATTASVRSYDGTGNNPVNTLWGSTGQTLIRLAPAQYADGVASPAGSTRPSARVVSNAVAAHGADEMPSSTSLSAYAYLWGQFIDHDLDLTSSASPSQSFNIAVPTGDTYFDPTSSGTQVIPLSRSKSASGSGVTSPRQQVTDITSFLDGSMVYGSDVTRANALREFVGGRLKTSAGNMLPYNTMGLSNDTLGGPASSYYAAGDARANENVELTSIQTLFMREHNRRAAQIASQHGGWSDEQIYQAARRLVIAEIQQVTYNEFLPALLGKDAIRPYAGYNPRVNPSISNEFSTAAFRLGHSMLPDDVEFLDNNGEEVRDAIPLAQAFFNPSLVASTGVDPILKYLASSNSEEIDTQVVDGLRNFLFGPPGAGGLDLASLNIQRGRDHGLADYNSTRAALGLPKVTSFAQITSDVSVQQALQSIYGTVDNIDLWVGGLAEDHVAGSNVGPTFQRILVDQFTRTRDGDRFWYQNALNPQEMQAVRGVQLSDIIQANSGVSNVQDDVFHFNPTIDGQVFGDRNGDGRLNLGEQGIAGRKVDLIDGTGAIAQTTTTDHAGRFVLSGIDLGSYTIKIETPTGWTTLINPSGVLQVTRGGKIASISAAQRPTNPPPIGPGPIRPSGPMVIRTDMNRSLELASAWSELTSAFPKL